MNMKEKIELVENTQGYVADVKAKLKEIICECKGERDPIVDDFEITGDNIECWYTVYCRGEACHDDFFCPKEWLYDDFDYREAHQKQIEEARRKREEEEEKKRLKEEKAREKAEYSQYLKLKEKFERKEDKE